MITLQFKDGLTENTFSFGNNFTYSGIKSLGLYFSEKSDNYPYILKGVPSGHDTFELEYSPYPHQLRGRILNTKKIKEVMDSSRIPIIIRIKGKSYLLGKGFLSTYDAATEEVKLLFIACIDDRKNITSIEQVRFFVSRDIYTDEHKALQPAIKDFITSHPGDVIVCSRILDYVGEKISMPRGGTIAEHNEYKKAVVRTALVEAFGLDHKDLPLPAETLHGTVIIHQGDDLPY